MPFKSEAQKRKIAQLEREGKVKKGTTEKWAAETQGPLPDRTTRKNQPKTIQEIKEIRAKKYGK